MLYGRASGSLGSLALLVSGVKGSLVLWVSGGKGSLELNGLAMLLVSGALGLWCFWSPGVFLCC